jgi:hypothetical protein
VKPKSVAFALVVGAFLVSVAPAQAGKWSYGNGPTDLWTVHPPGAGAFDVCTTRVHGRVGLSGFGDPAGPPPAAPPPPYATIKVNVYAGAPGSLNGASPVTGGLRLLNGTVLPPVASTTTAAPTALNPQEQYGPDVWVYAAAPFAVSIPSGAIPAGDDIIIQKDNYGGGLTAYETADAVDCDQSSWNGRVWNVRSAGDTIVTQTSSSLAVKIGTGATADPISTYVSDCVATGDFDARVHYSLVTWPAANSVRVGLLVNNPDYPSPDGSLAVERTSFAARGDVGVGENYVMDAVDPGGTFQTVPTTATTGDLRVKQKGAVITTYYKDSTTGGKWQTINTSPAYTEPVTLGLQIWGDKDQLTGPVKAKFTKFNLTGDCV